MTSVPSIDPRTGETVEIAAEETGTARVDEICAAALAAAGPLEEMGRDGRAALLDDLATALEEHRERIVAVADRETALGAVRLNGELTRTCYQLRLFGEVLRDGGYLEAAVDHAGDTPMGPRPDLRRMLVPIGPVAVFGASNFPLAFSVPGGDTASAIAAGSPVVLKAHHSHPATSQLCYEILAAAAAKAGAPAGTFGIVHGLRAGADLVAHPAIRAVGFTGSVAGAKALLAVIEKRPEPIPFHGELSSLNPVVVTPAAAADRAGRIGAEFAASFTLGAGQFCTKPGLAFVPDGPDGDAVVAAAQAAIAEMAPMVLLNAGIAAAYQRSTATGVEAEQHNGTSHDAGRGTATGGDNRRAVPLLFTATASDLPPEAVEERFGPVSVIARYRGEEDLFAAIATLPPSLTATVHRGPGETALPAELARRFRPHTGRLVFDGYPTGVAVAWAQHHGGPWPATNTQHSSVGATAIRRFLRPVTWQNAPEDLLPPELRDGYDSIPRRIDGVFRARL
ncbi:aldehyde dehydrogenase [Actinoplanes lobatus]|uniref:Aldehyde dehydrogenase n=1 Tax=Actinoplanes lobatus TaxID=113568 RepID=A0A7W7HG61_9ACTN|nr:aldehyde dehydrogenase family protein [Actinoplanes lobatus]MBB4749922.1 NADP-dependent aldehyde dehydrogenase [Actinoplanes lobatus]GGN95209.1 aldehyde dehydrogenase [Actinoplanes lobatus]GIE45013.1 aldehyde dehydrogenase [Actinoplanes lobatus]